MLITLVSPISVATKDWKFGLKAVNDFVFLFKKILLKYSWFIMCSFSVCSTVNQLRIYPLFLRLFSHIGHYRVSYRVPRWLSGKESTCQGRKQGFGPWVGKIPRGEKGNLLQQTEESGKQQHVGTHWWLRTHLLHTAGSYWWLCCTLSCMSILVFQFIPPPALPG